ncbi:hypothetical protein [Limosilactobacillus reuteri]|uniref:hypothetical protein n=1 Tax=Limosilactobacillus reuteri TaxID=1598 RepID=UPI001C5B88F7|nr:hypothetical protein [Limosilactobacillus reuteri]MBW3350668.1 hypothetical protein [Limosilactobacillus reuteri]UUW69710.1 hypothetical protein NUJ10_11775 [Limosilactobacillus reuteri]
MLDKSLYDSLLQKKRSVREHRKYDRLSRRIEFETRPWKWKDMDSEKKINTKIFYYTDENGQKRSAIQITYWPNYLMHNQIVGWNAIEVKWAEMQGCWRNPEKITELILSKDENAFQKQKVVKKKVIRWLKKSE